LSLTQKSGLLQFTCGKDIEADQQVTFKKTGASANAYQFSNEKFTVIPIDPPENPVMIKIKTDRAPTPIKYKLEVTCTLPGMIYYYNTMEKDYSEVTDLAEMKKRLSSPYSTLFE